MDSGSSAPHHEESVFATEGQIVLILCGLIGSGKVSKLKVLCSSETPLISYFRHSQHLRRRLGNTFHNSEGVIKMISATGVELKIWRGQRCPTGNRSASTEQISIVCMWHPFFLSQGIREGCPHRTSTLRPRVGRLGNYMLTEVDS